MTDSLDPTERAAIALRGVSKHYGAVRAVDGVDLGAGEAGYCDGGSCDRLPGILPFQSVDEWLARVEREFDAQPATGQGARRTPSGFPRPGVMLGPFGQLPTVKGIVGSQDTPGSQLENLPGS